jgi:pyridoxamine 5'-phosphate oxidase
MEEDLSDKRVNYTLGTLDEKMVKKNAIAQFKEWYDEASVTPGIVEANAMILCTATKDGIPSGRPLLLKVST